MIFVTGGTGFLGAYLLRHLVKQHAGNILALRRKDSPMQLVADIQDRIQWVEGDVLDVPLLDEIMQNVQRVYHCAAIVSFDRRLRKKMHRINVEGTANVVNLALYHDIEKLLHVSSIAAIGKPQKGGKLNERSKWIRSNYNSDYAISKYLSEQEVWRGMAEGLKVAVVNPSVIIGSGYWHRGTCELFNRVWKGQKLYPTGTTGFVDVRDVARMMIQLMEGPWENERFLANGENLSYLSFFTEVAKAIQREAPTIKATPFLTGIAWRAETLRTRIFGGQPIVTQSMAHTTARQYFYDNQKSINELDFSYTPIESTIRETGQQFLEAKKRGAKFSILPV